MSTWSVEIGPEHEVLGAELPAEPAEGTVVVDAGGKVYQRQRWHHFIDAIPMGSHVEWTGIGERRRAHRPTWVELLDRGPLTIVWRADGGDR